MLTNRPHQPLPKIHRQNIPFIEHFQPKHLASLICTRSLLLFLAEGHNNALGEPTAQPLFCNQQLIQRRSIRILANRVKEHIVNPEGQMIFISHGDCEDEANALADIIKAEIPGIAGVLVTYVGPVIGSHSGPGTLAIFFLGDHR